MGRARRRVRGRSRLAGRAEAVERLVPLPPGGRRGGGPRVSHARGGGGTGRRARPALGPDGARGATAGRGEQGDSGHGAGSARKRSKPCLSISRAATRMPSARSRLHTAAPMPPAAPVTTASRSLKMPKSLKILASLAAKVGQGQGPKRRRRPVCGAAMPWSILETSWLMRGFPDD